MLSAICFNLGQSKLLSGIRLKVFADHKVKVAIMMISVFDRIENIVRKGENAGFHFFSLFPQSFQKAFNSGLLKFGIVQ